MNYNRPIRILLFSLALAGTATAAAADASHYTSSSVLSTGRWVKIRVNESGIQQITHEQLRQWGFDDPAAVTVYGFGGVAGVPELLDGSVPDDLPQQLTASYGDRILFYGESNWRPNFVYFSKKTNLVAGYPDIERNHAADAGYYFITDSQPVQQHSVIPIKRVSTAATRRSHWDITALEEEVENPVRFGQLYFGKDISQDNDTLRYSFPLDDLYFETSNTTWAKVILHNIVVGSGKNLKYILNYPSRGNHVNKVIDIDNSNEQVLMSSNADRSDSYLSLSMPRTADTFDITLAKWSGSSFTYAAVDRIVFAYPRKNNLGDRPSMLMCDYSMPAGQSIEIADVDPEILVWNVNKPYNVRPYETSYNYGNRWVVFTSGEACNITNHTDYAHRIIAFDPKKEHHAVEYAGEIDNQDVHANDVPHMVILSADAFVDQAERLAQIHRDLLGHDVVVLRQDEIFNEFSSGTPSLWGIRKAMKMFYDRNPSKFKHLLLFGGAFYDNRGLTPTGASFKNKGALLLNYGTPYHNTMSKITTGYSCDAYFGMLRDTPPAEEFINSVQDINVGRIPVTDHVEATKAVDKIYQYLTYAPTSDIYQRVLLMADQGDSDKHLLSGEKTGDSFLANNPGMTLVKGYTSLYPMKNGKAGYANDAITQALKNGVMYVNYTGHGKPDFIGSANLYSISDVHNTQYSYYPFAMLATCRAYTFDCLEQSIAQEMVLQSNGGMIGVVAACREVYQSRNEVLSETLADIFAKSKAGTTTGDIFRQARNELLATKATSDPGLMINTSCYNLCGDPAIPLFFSDHKVALENVNGDTYNAAEASHTVVPLSENSITGYVEDPAKPGTPWSSFNGNVIFSLYEPAINRLDINLGTFNDRDSIHNVIADEDLLVEANAKVVNGKFTVAFTPPMPKRTGGYNRATVTAVLPDNSKVATTWTSALTCDVTAAPATPSDTEAPEITELYIDTPDFISGGMTGQNFTAYATVTDNGSGIYSPTGTVGPACRIVIDNTMNYPVVGTLMTKNSDGSVNISYPFTSLSDGRHTLTLHISDNAGNNASRTIEFTISNNAANPTLTVEEEPARVQATLSLRHNFTGTPSGRLIIEDESGNTVFSRESVSFPFEWDLTGTDGNLVADGVYRAYVICTDGNLYGSTPKADIIVVQQP